MAEFKPDFSQVVSNLKQLQQQSSQPNPQVNVKLQQIENLQNQQAQTIRSAASKTDLSRVTKDISKVVQSNITSSIDSVETSIDGLEQQQAQIIQQVRTQGSSLTEILRNQNDIKKTLGDLSIAVQGIPKTAEEKQKEQEGLTSAIVRRMGDWFSRRSRATRVAAGAVGGATIAATGIAAAGAIDAAVKSTNEAREQFKTTNLGDNAPGSLPMAPPGSAIEPKSLGSVPSSSPALTALKNEIAKGEGNYNSYNRGRAGDTPRPEIDITSLSIADIMRMQSGGAGQRQLFAVGKYQFIPNTLAEAVKYTNIDTSVKFDAAAQEKLFEYLISEKKRPRLNAYLTGKSNDINAAIDDLAREFASIPMSSGRGAYDGDRAGNRAAGGIQRVDKIRGILRELRSGGGTTSQGGAPEQQGPTSQGSSAGAGSAPQGGAPVSSGQSAGGGLTPGGNARPTETAQGGAPANAENNEAEPKDGERQASGGGNVKQSQSGIRKQPISDRLLAVLQGAAKASGVDVNVTSGGQPSFPNGPRTGSTRHDNGNAADIDLSVNGRILTDENPADIAIKKKFVQAAISAGATGIGAGYMGPTKIHVGFGAPAMWGGAPWLSGMSPGAGGGEAGAERGGGAMMGSMTAAQSNLSGMVMPGMGGGMGMGQQDGIGGAMGSIGQALGMFGGGKLGAVGGILGAVGGIVNLFEQMSGPGNRPLERRVDATDEISQRAVEEKRQQSAPQRTAAATTNQNREQMEENRNQGAYTERDQPPTAGKDSIYGDIGGFPEIGKLASAMYSTSLSTPMEIRVI